MKLLVSVTNVYQAWSRIKKTCNIEEIVNIVILCSRSPPIRCLCFRCSVIWSLRSASCEESCWTSVWVWSNWNNTEDGWFLFTCLCHLTWPWRVFHSFCSPSTSSTARDIALSLGNQSRHLSWKKIKWEIFSFKPKYMAFNFYLMSLKILIDLI